MTVDDINLYLPKFLSDEDGRVLYKAVRAMIAGQSKSYYTGRLLHTDVLYQGDGIDALPYIELPEILVKKRPGIILSNTCDIAPDNKRLIPARMLFVPLMPVKNYRAGLERLADCSSQQIEQHIDDIRNQRLTNVFYLPESAGRVEESLVYLDRVMHVSNSMIDRTQLEQRRLFTLSDFGAWLLVLKLSIHFSRIQDKVERGSD